MTGRSDQAASLAQAILEAQGYLIVASEQDRPVGHVFDGCGPWPDGSTLDAKMVVMEFATWEEFDEQTRRWSVIYPAHLRKFPDDPRCYKCVAE